MNKPIAPKDRTPAEFVAEFEKRHGAPYDCAMTAIINTMKEMLVEPAPNPFTPDQLAWMREEQRHGFKYAATDADGVTRLFSSVCGRDNESGTWEGDFHCKTHADFLIRILCWDDPEPLCFADYAPLEGAADV